MAAAYGAMAVGLAVGALMTRHGPHALFLKDRNGCRLYKNFVP